MKPFIKWVGGKRRLSSKIVELMPDSVDLYCEPFLGSGAVFLQFVSENKKAKKYILSDLNKHLINLWQFLKNDGEHLCVQIASLKHSYDNCADKRAMYCDWRVQLTDSEPLKQAALFFVLNKSSFNGLVRYNSTGQFNSAFGKRKSISVDFENMSAIQNQLKHLDIEFHNDTYENVLKLCDSGSTVYLDPPYLEGVRRLDKRTYCFDVFSGHMKIIDEVIRLDTCGAKFILSNHDDVFFREKLVQFKMIELTLPKIFTGKSSSRIPTAELLIHNLADTVFGF